MNIYKVSQQDNTGYDTYDSFVCYATNEEAARNMLPSNNYCNWGEEWANNPSEVTVTQLGITDQEVEVGVIVASFNAG